MPVVMLNRKLEHDLIAACRIRLPYEACGIMYGNLTESSVTAEGFAIIRNTSPFPENRFTFDQNDWIAACYEAQKNQRLIVGLFHSHPDGTVAPSLHDEEARAPWESYWIVSFANDQGVVRAYKRDARHRFVALQMVRESR